MTGAGSATGRLARALGIGATIVAVVASAVACRSQPAGRSDTPREIRRVVSLVPSVTDVILALGLRDRLVGRTDYDLDARLGALPTVGGATNPSAERLAAIRPDLIIGWRVGGSPAVDQQMSRLGLPVRRVGTETWAELRETIRSLGTWLDVRGRADSLLRAIKDTLAAVRADAARRPRVRVCFLVALDPPIVAGPGSFVDELINVAGGANVFSDAPQKWPTVALESVVHRNPAVLVWPRYVNGPSWDEALRSHSAWLAVPAVRDRRVVTVEAELLLRPDAGFGSAARRLSDALVAAASGPGSAGQSR